MRFSVAFSTLVVLCLVPVYALNQTELDQAADLAAAFVKLPACVVRESPFGIMKLVAY